MAANTDDPPDTEADIIDYYDIMVIGRTGMGKSTTSDKLVIANPDGRNYREEKHSNEEIVNENQVQMSDLSVWLVPDGAEDVLTRHLIDLIMARSLDEPHTEITNIIYKGVKIETSRCQVFSNETTKTRVLDVPGFFGEDLSGKPKQDTASQVTITGFRIMREILRIQALLRMHFRRIIYFIPERGPLERPHKVLQMELEQMLHYFGKIIFNCMMLVVTQPANMYKYIPPNMVPFSDEDRRITRDNFAITLRRALKLQEDDKSADHIIPPIVFLSMRDSCEDVMRKVKEAPVISQQLTIPFECQACSRCGLKAKWLKNKENKKVKIACYAGDDPTLSMPYEESQCHPMIIPKYYKITKIVGGIAHIITWKKFKDKWPDFHNKDDEICIACNQIPGTPGCEKVRTNYVYRNKFNVFVDHKSDPTEPIFIEGDDPDEHRQLKATEQQWDTDSEEQEIPANGRDSQSPEPQHNLVVTATVEPQQSAGLRASEENPAYFNITSDEESNQWVDHIPTKPVLIVNQDQPREIAINLEQHEDVEAYEHRQPAEAENPEENADEQLQQVRNVKSGIPMAVDFLTEAMKLANVSFVDHNVLECDYSGIEYTNKKHNFFLQIPEGAIPRGEKICFEVAIAMHGPFILPKDTRLVSPILWLCPLEENVTFNKPFQVVIPHILYKITEEKAKKYQLGFAKANHRKISYNNTGNAEYIFQPLTPLECNVIFSSTNELGFGTVTMSHFCYLCITAKNTPELKSDISYCLTRATRPATARRHEVCFCVSYCLGTCIEAIRKQFKQENGYALYSSSSFRVSTSDCVNILVQDNENCIIARTPRVSKIWISEVDFQAHQYDEMRLLHDIRVYPPRVNVSVDMTTSNTIRLAYNVEGTDSDQRLSGELLLPFNESVAPGSTAPPIRGERPFEVSIALRLTLPVASNWKVIGALLGIPNGILREIASNEAEVQDRLLALLNALSCRRPPPTWEALAEAVEHFNPDVAEKIRRTQSVS